MDESFSEHIGFEISAVKNPKTNRYFGLIQFSTDGQHFGIAVRKPEFDTSQDAEDFAQAALADPESPISSGIEHILEDLKGATITRRSGGLTLHQGGLS